MQAWLTSVPLEVWRSSAPRHFPEIASILLACTKIYPSWVLTSRVAAHGHSWEPSRWVELGLSWHIHIHILMNTPGILWPQWLLPVHFSYHLTICIHSYINWTTISSGGPCMFASLDSYISSHPLFLEGPFSQATQILTAGMFSISGFFITQY